MKLQSIFLALLISTCAAVTPKVVPHSTSQYLFKQKYDISGTTATILIHLNGAKDVAISSDLPNTFEIDAAAPSREKNLRILNRFDFRFNRVNILNYDYLPTAATDVSGIRRLIIHLKVPHASLTLWTNTREPFDIRVDMDKIKPDVYPVSRESY